VLPGDGQTRFRGCFRTPFVATLCRRQALTPPGT